MNLIDAVQVVRPSVVQFAVQSTRPVARQPFGSGFIIDEDGIVATAAHVVAFADKLAEGDHEVSLGLAFPNFSTAPDAPGPQVHMRANFYSVGAEVLLVDERNDVAILKMKPNPFDVRPRPMAVVAGMEGPTPQYAKCQTACVRPCDGEHIGVSGYPLSSPTLITTAGYIASGWATAPRTVFEGEVQTTVQGSAFLADISVNPGNSGGPTYRVSDGQVIGVCTAYQHAPLMYRDEANGTVKIDGRPVGINSGLSVITPIAHVLDLVRAYEESQENIANDGPAVNDELLDDGR